MPLGCLIQDGDNNDCQEDGLGVKGDLSRYVKQNFRRNESYTFVSRDFVNTRGV